MWSILNYIVYTYNKLKEVITIGKTVVLMWDLIQHLLAIYLAVYSMKIKDVHELIEASLLFYFAYTQSLEYQQ